MFLERQGLSRGNFGSLQGCLVEGDPEQRAGEQRVRRRALAISIVVQGAVLAALVLVPLFGKPQRIALASTPIPPYYSSGGAHRAPSAPPRHASPPRNICRFCAPRSISPIVAIHNSEPTSDAASAPTLTGSGPATPGEIPLLGTRTGAKPPPPVETQVKKRMVHMTQLDPAMLTHRVEPVYPILAKQIGRSGRVELRAVIATDGTIQSLQVVSGDPLFYKSALDGVQQWRYKPTVLNGQPVEIDTYITVFYNLQR